MTLQLPDNKCNEDDVEALTKDIHFQVATGNESMTELYTRMCQLLTNPADGDFEMTKVVDLLQHFSPILTTNEFITHLCYYEQKLPFELLWNVCSHSPTSLQQYLTLNYDKPTVISEITDYLLGVISNPHVTKNQRKILSSFLSILVLARYSDLSAAKNGFKHLQLAAGTILDQIASAMNDEQQCYGRNGTNVYQLIAENGGLDLSTIQQYFSTQLAGLLRNSNDKVLLSAVVNVQEEWTFTSTKPFLRSIIVQLIEPFALEDLRNMIERILEHGEVNWKHFLTFLSHLIILYPMGSTMLQDILLAFIDSGCETSNKDKLIVALIIARQISNERLDTFSYENWFQYTLGKPSANRNKKKYFELLFTVLTDLVPYEPVSYLKVHLLNPPDVPIKNRFLLGDYNTLLRTGLQDHGQSINEILKDGNAQDGKSKEAQLKMKEQALEDVEKLLQFFSISKKIPADIIEASIFKKPYFATYLLPTLLQPRQLPDKPDDKIECINALLKKGKIPHQMYQKYKTACEKLPLQNANVPENMNHAMDQIEILLQRFPEVVLSASKSGSDSGISKHIATIAKQLSNAIVDKTQLDVINLNFALLQFSQHCMQVANLILKTFCKTQCAISEQHYNFKSEWAYKIISICVPITNLLKALYHRLRELIIVLGLSLDDCHVFGLSAVLAHFGAMHRLLCPVSIENGVEMNIVDVIIDALPNSSIREKEFCLKFCSLYLLHAILSYSSYSLTLPTTNDEAYISPSMLEKLSYVPKVYPDRNGSKYQQLFLHVYFSKRFQELLKQ